MQCFLGYKKAGHEALYHDVILETLRILSFERIRDVLIS